jgi:N-acetylglucosamine-6-sulfatase
MLGVKAVRFVRVIAAVVVFGLVGVAGPGQLARPSLSHSAASAQPPARPNILFILTDDQDVETLRFMPRVQTLLAAEGITFSNAFVTQSLCCPSRASILRGQYPHNTEIIHNQPPTGGFEKFRDLGHESSTLATWLQAAGYQTALFGKYLNGYLGRSGESYVPPGWSEWNGASADPIRYFGQQISENGQVVTYGSDPSDYHTDVLTEKVVRFLETRPANAPPFFIYLSGPAPHAHLLMDGSALPAPRHQELFADLIAPRPPSFNGAPPLNQPRPLLTEEQIDELDHEYRTRVASLQAVDEGIERIIETLSARGELENTYIFFTSDNGYHMGQHRIPRGKNTLFEEAIRVPGIVRGPGVPAGLTRNQLVLNIDFAPTFAELAGASIPDFVDGRSLMPLLRATSPAWDQWRQDFLAEVSLPTGATSRALRTHEVAYFEFNSGQRALYDLREDPYQINSLHETAPPEGIAALSARLSALAVCAGTSCRE